MHWLDFVIGILVGGAVSGMMFVFATVAICISESRK
jgi:hypothetical protein